MLRGWKLTGDGRFLERFLLIDKGNVRKGFFHLPRRLLDCLELLERK